MSVCFFFGVEEEEMMGCCDVMGSTRATKDFDGADDRRIGIYMSNRQTTAQQRNPTSFFLFFFRYLSAYRCFTQEDKAKRDKARRGEASKSLLP